MDIRKQTGLIVRKGKLFVQTVSLLTSGTLWSACAYDAWRTRNVNKAIAEAERVGGELWLFNPATGQLRPADMNKICNRRRDENERGDLQQAEGNPQERSVETEQESGTF